MMTQAVYYSQLKVMGKMKMGPGKSNFPPSFYSECKPNVPVRELWFPSRGAMAFGHGDTKLLLDWQY